MENEKKIIIDDLVSEILKDYQDDKVINQQAIFSQPDKDSVNDLLQKLIKIMYPGYYRSCWPRVRLRPQAPLSLSPLSRRSFFRRARLCITA